MLWVIQTFVLTLATIVGAAVLPPLQPCPSSPNCVSSQATGSHFIEAFRFTSDPSEAFERLIDILEKRSDSQIISADTNTVRVEFKTLLGFVDDGIFVMDSESRLIHIRSASRSGYWDLGKNRRRLEAIRKEFQNEYHSN